MPSASLIPENVFYNLPESNEERFLLIAEAAQERISSILNGKETAPDAYASLDWRRQYMMELFSAARELDIAGLPQYTNSAALSDQFANFQGALAGILIPLRIRSNSISKALTVALPASAKDKIQSEIDKLRTQINLSNLPDERKKTLLAKVDEIEKELYKSRSKLSSFGDLLGLATVFGLTVSTVADSKQAYDNIAGIAQAISSISITVADERSAADKHDDRIAGRIALPAPQQQLPDLRAVDPD